MLGFDAATYLSLCFKFIFMICNLPAFTCATAIGNL